jgi:hypothetical protein
LSFFSYVFPQNNLSKDFPVLNKTYQADAKRADYIIVLDQSGSMQQYWGNVKTSLSTLIGFLPDEDYLSILGFSSQCQPLVIPAKLSSDTKRSLIEQLKQLPLPTGPSAQRTDLYEAIDKTLEEINRPNSNELKFIFFLTDYINDPPSNTKWNNSNIHLLNEKYIRVVDQSKRLLKLYALQLPLDINAGRDYDQFSSIFHTISSPIFLTQNTLVEWFERLRTEIEREKLRLIVEKDLKYAVTVEGISSSTSIIEENSHVGLTLKNNSRLNLYIDSVAIFTNEYGQLSASFSDYSLEPNSISDLTVDLNENIKSLPGLVSKKYPFTVDVIKVFVSTKEKVEFGKLNLESSMLFADNNKKEIEIILGFSYTQTIILIIILIAILCFLFCPCLKPVWLFNKKTINVSMYLNEKIVELNESVFASSKNSVSINNSIIKDPVIRNIFNFRIDFVPRKPKCVIRRPKGGTYVYMDSTDSFELVESLTDETNRRSLGKENPKYDKPVEFKNGIRIFSAKLYQASNHKLEISISTQ